VSDNIGNILLKRVLTGLQVQYNPTLTRADLELLDKKILLQMMRNRIVLAFNKPPMWNRFGLDKIEGMYYVDRMDRESTHGWSTGESDKIYHFWFELPKDRDHFLQNIAELKLTHC
tara:strand:- start:2928 stop:3275 length:348 start_codon:yes stop_codon:yes gene_type:complete